MQQGGGGGGGGGDIKGVHDFSCVMQMRHPDTRAVADTWPHFAVLAELTHLLLQCTVLWDQSE